MTQWSSLVGMDIQCLIQGLILSGFTWLNMGPQHARRAQASPPQARVGGCDNKIIQNNPMQSTFRLELQRDVQRPTFSSTPALAFIFVTTKINSYRHLRCDHATVDARRIPR